MENRNGAVMKQYESIKNSKLFECAESCYNELNETKVIPVLSDAELEEYGVREMILFNFRSSVKSWTSVWIMANSL